MLEDTSPPTQGYLHNTSQGYTTLLSTKWSIPPARARMLSRPRLYEQLHLIKRCSLTLISAPAGSGKTTLLSEWYAASREDACAAPLALAWLSLDQNDNDPQRFWAYFIMALDTLQKGIGKDALTLHQSSQSSAIESILTVLLNSMAALPYDFALILDDYHFITTQSLHHAVEFLLDHMPQNMHLVIASRTTPPFSLGRRRAGGQLNELSAADLRFTYDETTAFFNEVMQLHLSEEVLAALEARIEGWIAGLQLAALSMRVYENISEFVAAFTGSQRYIIDYFIEEVLGRQSEQIQNFLLQTCIVERLEASLCDALTGEAHGQSMLVLFEQTNLFIMPLDDLRQWYRYHSLFADVLQTRLHQVHPDWIPELHLKASRWYEDHKFLSEAIDHALAAMAFEQAVILIEQAARTMTTLWAHREFRRLQGWLDMLPQTLLHTRAQLCILHAWVLFSRVLVEPASGLEAIEACLHDAERALSSGNEGPEIQIMRGEIAVIFAGITFLKGEISRTIPFAQQALELLPQHNTTLREVAARTLMNTYVFCGDMTIAERALGELLGICQATDDIYAALNALFNVAQLQTIQGHLHQAVATYHRMLQLAGQKSQQLIPAPAYIGLGSILLEWNDIDAAADALMKGIEQCKKGGDPSILIYGYNVLAWLRQAQGKVGEALQATEEAEYVLQKYRALSRGDFGNVQSATLKATRAWLHLVQGDIEAANSWALTCTLTENEPVTPQLVRELSIRVRIYLANENFAEALQLSGRLLQAKIQYLENNISLLSLQALAFSAQGKSDRALNSLARALSLAEPGGYIRIFVNEGKPMAALLVRFLAAQQKGRLLLTKNVSQDYICQLLAASGIAVTVSDALRTKRMAQPRVVSLSEREREVLHLIGAGLSDREIAAHLMLAEGTIKTHAKRIYTKLGVSTRTQAVLRARDLQLL